MLFSRKCDSSVLHRNRRDGALQVMLEHEREICPRCDGSSRVNFASTSAGDRYSDDIQAVDFAEVARVARVERKLVRDCGRRDHGVA